MATPQFNKKTSTYSWFSLTFQSNDLLNVIFHNSAKVEVAKLLTSKFTIAEIHSYVHCNIIFAIDTKVSITIFDKICLVLEEFMPRQPQELLFNLVLIAKDKSTPPKQIMYISGSEEANKHFKEAIKPFYPKK